MSIPVNVIHNFQTFKLKVTPSTLLSEIVNDSCSHFKLDHENSSYILKSQSKTFKDLSLPVKFANLPQGCKLELTKDDTQKKPLRAQSSAFNTSRSKGLQSASSSSSSSSMSDSTKSNRAQSTTTVTIKLQIIKPNYSQFKLTSKEYQDGSLPVNLIHKFDSNTKLSSVLTEFENLFHIDLFNNTSLKFIDLNTKTTKLITLKPAIQSYTKTFESEKDFEYTLNSIGLSSNNHVLRLRFKETSESITESTVEEIDNSTLEQTASAESESLVANKTSEKLETVEVKPIDTPIDTLEPMDEDKDDDKDEPLIQVFKPTDHPVNTGANEYDEDNYNMTVDQAKLYQSILSKRASGGSLSTSLMTKAQRERENNKLKSNSVKKFDNIIIRIRFPDRSTLQLNLLSNSTLGDLYNLLIDKILELSKSQKLKLTTTNTTTSKDLIFKLLNSYPHTEILSTTDDLSLKLADDCKFNHRSLLIYEEDSSRTGPFIKEEYLANAKSAEELDEIKSSLEKLQKIESDSNDNNTYSESQLKNLKDQFENSISNNNVSDEKKVKMPKWFKLGKK
ncbi:unnamed protein product [[Candida] boidinii]|uniref:Unnamed protein product n=1 Tax=Candida boidinii TaxID=5477 RepID=A0A9W6WF31_CANBO|nr:hypothetical protein B5S30_g5642 [[Candida] boidinii]OWB85912.1 hypothetical protein B5S33_g4588 [[Candida] boidinii]GME68146.1 unnamed protein product [[Candida] boidinii]GME89821.1 unnamed protein product [[Candida] boidinii]